jgi:hypothetical protein
MYLTADGGLRDGKLLRQGEMAAGEGYQGKVPQMFPE